ncbi:MAG TPA: hypothetical protein VJN18_25580 [Polyangiaceae bacterium]|nr:hypothetical protein [Polyangiaceae bacterium]
MKRLVSIALRVLMEASCGSSSNKTPSDVDARSMLEELLPALADAIGSALETRASSGGTAPQDLSQVDSSHGGFVAAGAQLRRAARRASSHGRAAVKVNTVPRE